MSATILANVARHIQLSPAEERLFLDLLVPEHVARQQHLLLAGQPTRWLTFVVHGCIRTYVVDAQAKEHVLAFATEGWWCGDFASVFSQTPSTLHLQALEETQVLHLSLDRLERLCQQVPAFERFFRLLFQNGYLMSQRRLEAQLQQPAVVRYADFRRQWPRLHRRVAQKHIASFLGMTPEFLSLLRKKMPKKGES